MGPACLKMNGTFRLGQTALESQAAHHVPECAIEFIRAILFLKVSRREGERCVTDSKRVVASLADRG